MSDNNTPAAPQEHRPAAPALPADAPRRPYWEVFGNTINQLEWFKNLSIIMAGAVIFLSILLVKSINKMPLVIRVDSLGNAEAFKNVKSANAVTTAEINNFTQYFLQYWTAGNYYTYEDDFRHAFKMMTENYQRKAADYMSTHGQVDYIKQNQIKTKMTISEIIILKDSKDFVNLKVKGTNEIRSYQAPDFFKEEIFDYELSLGKVERSENTPWGLLVDSWSPSYFKK